MRRKQLGRRRLVYARDYHPDDKRGDEMAKKKPLGDETGGFLRPVGCSYRVNWRHQYSHH